ncbi:Hsp70 family protein [Iamia sp. SCSIO 61187]|uniref:Hsp70 family protein n=1 Tax=Iamia sp. SCSIO 61187 TaxID=2722752 RepID=UPI001C62E586|nr:Hsp70 family protein [Iamia sp. SCSIO 61187]QYG91110.1 Hsp70 family protein [Iamia sp. SCSIO 61187]
MWNLAIDFGTSNTTGATWADGVVEAVEVAGDRRVPSVVLLSAGGTWIVGREADNQAAVVPERVERAPKRRLGKGHTLLLGGQAVPINDAVAALLGPHTEAARAKHGGEPGHIVLTHPARWGPERIDVLRAAARQAGFSRVEFCPEPVAAAHYVEDPLEVGQHVAVYDLGGGTFDTCVMRRTETSFKVVGLPGGTERIGGEDFDHRMFQHLGSLVAREDPTVWENMQTSDERAWRRAGADLLTQARAAKEQLSRNPRASVYVGSLERDITVTRDEFEALIAADVDRTVDEMARTIESAGLSKYDIAKVYLVGGSSRLPLVQQRMGERYGDRVSTWDDPKGAVVLGAAKFSGTLQAAEAAGTPLDHGLPQAPVPSGPIQVSAPPPRPGGATPGPDLAKAPGPPPPPPAAAPAAPAGYGAPPGAPAYAPAAAAPPAWSPGAAPAPGYAPSAPAGAKAPGSDKILFAWIGAATFLLCCLPGPLVGLYFANEAKKEGHPQGQTALLVNAIAAGVVLVAWVFWFLATLASSGSST